MPMEQTHNLLDKHKGCCLHLYNIQKVLPAVYDDSLSYYELLAKVQYVVQELCAFARELDDDNKDLKASIDALAEEFERFKESGFDDYYAEQIAKWVNDNMPDILSQATKMVFFGLTTDGYFCAYIPEQWAFVFDTIIDYDSDDYGHLTITY